MSKHKGITNEGLIDTGDTKVDALLNELVGNLHKAGLKVHLEALPSSLKADDSVEFGNIEHGYGDQMLNILIDMCEKGMPVHFVVQGFHGFFGVIKAVHADVICVEVWNKGESREDIAAGFAELHKSDPLTHSYISRDAIDLITTIPGDFVEQEEEADE